MELADMPDLGSGERSCRFDPCHPHQTFKLFMMFHEEFFNIVIDDMDVYENIYKDLQV